MSRNRAEQRVNNLRRAAIGGVVVGLFVFGWYGVRMYQNRKMTEAVIAERNAAQEYQVSSGDWQIQEAISDIFKEDVVEWNGTSYHRNSYVKAILCMGVDRSDSMTQYQGFDKAGQADAIILLAQDTARNTLKVLMIPRDTMVEIGIINPDMSSAGTEIRQLALAYANGDGRESSCENTVEAVERLLHGFEIDYYLATDTKVVSLLNDAVGGVTVTVPTAGMEKKDPAFVKGETITLQGKQAEHFVRYRDIESAYSAMYRMDQQQEYITGFFEALKETSKQDSQIVQHLFELIQDYMVTDMGKEQYMQITVDALNEGGLERDDFYTVPGSSVTTDLYEEYYADENGITQVILNLFYRKSSIK